MDLDLTVEEVDALTGPAIGRAQERHLPHRRHRRRRRLPSRSRREPLRRRARAIPEREVFKVPDFMKAMVERGLARREDGRRASTRRTATEIRTLDWKTLEYRERQQAEVRRRWRRRRTWPTWARACNQILAGKDKARAVPVARAVGTSLYAARLVPEISDDVVSVDRAMEWGYGWGHGPSGCWTRWAWRPWPSARGPRAARSRRWSSSCWPRAASASTRSRTAATTMFGPSGVAPVPDGRASSTSPR